MAAYAEREEGGPPVTLGDLLMRRTIVALALFCFVAAPAPALEVVNFRPCYGPHGATRKVDKLVAKIQPGDTFFADYAIEGLTVNQKSGNVEFTTKLEFFDSSGKSLLARENKNTANLDLGGNRINSDVILTIGRDTAPGKYKIQVTITDKLGSAKTSITQDVEVVPPTFAIVQVESLAAALPGTNVATGFGLVGFKLGGAMQLPKAEITVRILDASEKPVGQPTKYLLPEALPAGPTKQIEFAPIVQPIFLNRPGQFYVDIVAIDKNANDAKVELRIPLAVVDINKITK
jgi:hypothetical protein